MIMSILSGNIAEGKVEEVEEVQPKPVPKKSEQIVHVDVGPTCKLQIESDVKVNVFLKFTFSMDELILNLYAGGDSDVSGAAITFYIIFQCSTFFF